MSIYKKIFLVAFIFTLLGLSLSTLLNIRTTRSILYEGATKHALTIFRSLQEKCKYAITIIDAQSMETYVDRKSLEDFVRDIERHESEVSEVLILEPSGKVLSSMQQEPGNTPPDRYAKLLEKAAPGKTLQRRGENELLLMGDIQINGISWGTAILDYSLLPIQKEVSNLTYRTLFMGGVFLLLAAALALPLVSTIVRPIKKLGEYASAIGDGNLNQPIPVDSRDEIGQLAASFAEMVSKLKQAMETLEHRMQELRQSEELVRNSEKNYRDLFENSVVGGFQCNTLGAFIRVNPSMAAMLGYDSPEELIVSVTGIFRDFFVHEEDRRKLARILRQEARIVGFETEVYKKDSAVVWVAVSARAVRDATGEIAHIEGSLLDRTASKEKEIAEREKEAAKASNEAKSAFLANMSHEIRTPMNAILGFSNLALQRDMPPQLREYLLKINSATNALIAIINDILDFSKIEAGKLSIEPTTFNLQCVLEATLDALSLKSSEKGLEMLLDMDQSIPCSLIGDPTRLRQVLLNLGSNAVKFTQAGEIVLKVELLQHEGQALRLLFTVSDTGIGLKQEQIPRLFKSFSQADSSTTRKYGGSGLGLAICKNLVELMQGTISVESVHGQGSRFFFELPFELSDEVQHEHVLSELPKDLRAVVLDDNGSARKLLQRYLQELGISAEAVADADALIALAKQAPQATLAFIDMQMPGQDGLHIVDLVRKEPELSRLPCILLCTAYDSQGRRMPSAGSGIVQGTVSKPVTPARLYEFMAGLFSGKHLGRGESEATTCSSVCTSYAGCRVLLVEDNELNQQLALEFLKDEGLEIIVAENGKQALQRLEERRFDLVLMDIQMPVMDGYAATRKIREHPHLKGLPVVAMTAHAMHEERDKCLEAGMNDHIQKPFHKHELLKMLEHWLMPAAASLSREQTAPPDQPKEQGGQQTSEQAAAMTLLKRGDIQMEQDRQQPSEQTASPQKSAREVPAPQSVSSSFWAELAPLQGEQGLQALPEMPGVDVQKGLAFSNDNEHLYRTLLVQFREQGHKLWESLREAAEESDTEALATAAHSLKGTSRLIGAGELSQAAARLEQIIKEQSPWQELLAMLQTHLQEVLDSLDKLSQNGADGQTVAKKPGSVPQAGSDTSEGDPALLQEYDASQVASLLQSLRHSLENDVKLALKNAATLDELLRETALADEARTLKSEVFDFEIRSAIKHLETLAAQIGADLS